MIGQVHDSVILYVHYSEFDDIINLVKATMESAPIEFKPDFFKVPLPVDIQYGNNWADLKTYE